MINQKQSEAIKTAYMILEEVDFRMESLSKWEKEFKELENRSAVLNCFNRYDELLRLKNIIKTIIEYKKEGY
jgi:hypothetical protein